MEKNGVLAGVDFDTHLEELITFDSKFLIRLDNIIRHWFMKTKKWLSDISICH